MQSHFRGHPEVDPVEAESRPAQSSRDSSALEFTREVADSDTGAASVRAGTTAVAAGASETAADSTTSADCSDPELQAVPSARD